MMRFLLAAALASCLTWGGESVAAEPVPAPNYDVPIHGQGKFIPTPDGRLYYETEGSGPPVIVVAGGPGGSHASFHPWFSRLADKWTVVYFDNIGRGRSDRLADPARYTIPRDAEDIERLRVALGAEKISLIGHSYGGMPALAYALAHPDRVQHLVLNDTLIDDDTFQRNMDATNALVRELYPEVWSELMRLRAEGVVSSDERQEELYGKAGGDLYWYDTDSAKLLFRSGDAVDRLNSDIYLAMLGPDPEWTVGGTIKGYNPRPQLGKLNVPTLVIVGRYDRVASPRTAAELRSLLPAQTSRLAIFEKSGHRPWLEESDRWFALVRAFLDKGLDGVDSTSP